MSLSIEAIDHESQDKLNDYLLKQAKLDKVRNDDKETQNNKEKESDKHTKQK